MKLHDNKMFYNIERLFDDIASRYDIVIDDLTQRKMLLEICNLNNRSVFGLDELETYIIRCKYGIYYKSVGTSYEDISNLLQYSVHTVRVIYLKSLVKIYEYIQRSHKILEYGSDCIYSLMGVPYLLLEKFESRGILSIDELLSMDLCLLYDLLEEFRMYLVPVFDNSVVKSHARKDFNNILDELSDYGKSVSKTKLRVVK